TPLYLPPTTTSTIWCGTETSVTAAGKQGHQTMRGPAKVGSHPSCRYRPRSLLPTAPRGAVNAPEKPRKFIRCSLRSLVRHICYLLFLLILPCSSVLCVKETCRRGPNPIFGPANAARPSARP